MSTSEMLPILIPILALQVLLLVFALRDLLRPERHVRGGSKPLWGIVVVCIGIIGPLVYFTAGREEA